MYCPVVENCRVFGHSCFDCAASLASEDEAIVSEMPLLYSKVLLSSPEHPLVGLRRHRRTESVKVDKQRKQTAAWRDKSYMVRKAFREEEVTRRQIIRATKRSGALNGDGDSRLGDGQWGVDDKRHSRASSTISVSVADVEKASNQSCVLVVTLATGRKFVIAELDDFVSASESIADALKKTAE